MNLRYCALALAITFSLSLPVSAADISAPRPADIPASTQQLALMIHCFNADLSSVEHTHDITGSPKREAHCAVYTTAGCNRSAHLIMLRCNSRSVGLRAVQARIELPSEATRLQPQAL